MNNPKECDSNTKTGFLARIFMPVCFLAMGLSLVSCKKENINGQPGDGNVFAVKAILTGTAESEKLQGFESNDTVTGGGGADLFPFTAGTDVITDFNPAEDMIDVGDFARPSDHFNVLVSLEAIRTQSTEVVIDGKPSLQIDVDGDKGVSTTTLVGVTMSDLNEGNVFFGLGSTSIPPLDFTHIAKFLVTYSNGEVWLYPAHDLSNHPIAGTKVSG